MIRKLLTLLLSITIALVVIPLTGFNNVKAYNQDYKYPFTSDLNYEVAYINDDGSFTTIECYSDFESAKTKMKENEDYVVRHIDSYSPSRIIAMNSGLVYAYSRSSSDIINIYEGVKGVPNNTQNYVDRYFEMSYIDTTYMSSINSGEGYIKVNLGGFIGYADLEYTDLVPSKYIDKQIPIYLGGPYGSNSYSPYQVICEPDYYMVEKNGNYNDLVLYYHNAYKTSDSNLKAYCWSMSIGNASDYPSLKAGIKYYSCDGVNFYDSYKYNSKQLVGSGYNYYQFLPLRSKSNISADILNSFITYKKGSSTNSVIKSAGSSFINGQETYGSNAAIVYSMACWESSYGTSGYATKRYNLFGWNAYDDTPDNASYFSSVDKCISEQAGANLRDYSDVNVKWFNGAYLGNKGSGFNLKYCSDPYWGAGISAIYYSLDKYANNFNGNLSDHGTYDLGIVSTFGAPVYTDTSQSSTWFNCKYSDTRNLNYMVSILEDTGSFYKIQLSNPVSNGTMISRVDGTVNYDWSNSIGYVKKSDIALVTNNNSIEINHDTLCYFSKFKLENNNLIIEGIGIISAYNFNDSNAIKHEINVYKLSDDSLVTTIACNNVENSKFNLNDGYDYTYGSFATTYDISALEKDSYYFKLKTTINVGGNTISKEKIASSTSNDLSNCVMTNDASMYRLTINDIYNYRFELHISNNIDKIDFSSIRKPTIRSSMATTYISFDDNGICTINGVGMIYYLDYNTSDPKHNLYLINNEEIIKLETTTNKSSVDLQALSGSKYNMDYVCYSANVDCNALTGNYHLLLEIKNGDYVDYCYLNNIYGINYENYSSETTNVSFLTDSINAKIIMKVEH